MPIQLISSRSGQPAGALDWQADGARLDIANLPAFDAAAIDPQRWSLWRYAAMLPVDAQVTLGEGMTPLVDAQIAGHRFKAKLENLNPTGSFKDRGTALLVNYLLSQGVTEVIEDSSGNAGASLAAFCGKAGIKARVFVPAHAPEGKKRLIASFGAELVEIEGPRAAATAACLEAAQHSVYASHAWSPLFVAGQMTCAWEIWEQMGLPDAILCPVGHGGLFVGLARGFKALQSAGLIERLPRLFAVQSAACDPIVRAWEQGASESVAVTPVTGLADGISVAEPVHGAEILATLRETGGAALRVDDESISSALNELHQQGIMVEATSAVPAAALMNAPIEGQICLPMTGNGLKNL